MVKDTRFAGHMVVSEERMHALLSMVVNQIAISYECCSRFYVCGGSKCKTFGWECKTRLDSDHVLVSGCD